MRKKIKDRIKMGVARFTDTTLLLRIKIQTPFPWRFPNDSIIS